MARIGIRRRAKAILDFLARRTGYESAILKEHLHCEGIMTLAFRPKESASGYYFDEDVMVSEHGSLNILSFHSSTDTETDVLKHLLKHKSEILVLPGPDMNSDYSYASDLPWIRVFADDDCLESLALKCDLEEGTRLL